MLTALLTSLILFLKLSLISTLYLIFAEKCGFTSSTRNPLKNTPTTTKTHRLRVCANPSPVRRPRTPPTNFDWTSGSAGVLKTEGGAVASPAATPVPAASAKKSVRGVVRRKRAVSGVTVATSSTGGLVERRARRVSSASSSSEARGMWQRGRSTSSNRGSRVVV